MLKDKLKQQNLNPAQILVLGFALIILVGGILLSTPFVTQTGESTGFLKALFTSTSAVCVTGLVVVDTGTHWNMAGQIIILILIQIGGLGIMTMATSVALIIGRKISLRSRLIMQEALNQFTIQGVVRLTKYIIITTFVIEGIGAFFLAMNFIPDYGVPKGIFFGIFHSISAFCNAGFDIIGGGRSLTPYTENLSVNFIVMSLIILGGLGFTVIIDLIRSRSYKKLTLHSKIVVMMTVTLILVGFVLFFVMEFNNPDTMKDLSLKGKLTAAMFQSVTTRTAGFNTIDLAQMHDSSKLLTVLLMFIGGSPGSTAGGMKTTTVALVILLIISVVKGRDDVEFSRRRISRDNVNRALTVVGVGISLGFLVVFLLTMTEKGADFITLLFEAISALGTVGLSLGYTSSLSALGQIIIIFTMFAGRVGALTIVFALAQSDNKALIRYPESKVSVG
ncbi:Trk family potassium uptake protein [Acidaminobacter sp. JC074]|uniref:TrkH family potassium uptake protein n=1 Tax=Acidaminobacter sp. JC074 TaxID=2530199 RepID=UPI001F109EF4|nr:TrkH family potassium uptake protein [Acidaminobacter sp. JC074]MCH4888652.1 Trk family potassium uptake protein [Acidaminobacter sp. JC074]